MQKWIESRWYNEDFGAKTACWLSDDDLYRYLLIYTWDASKPQMILCMLNPSTATARKPDNTVKSCIRIAKSNGFGGISIINLFAFRTAKPKIMRAATDPIGEHNLYFHHRAINTNDGSKATVVCAWGANVEHSEFAVRFFIDLMKRNGINLKCLGTTKNGHPCHPLFLRGDTSLQTFQPEEEEL